MGSQTWLPFKDPDLPVRRVGSAPSLTLFVPREDPEYPCFPDVDDTLTPRICVWQFLNRKRSAKVLSKRDNVPRSQIRLLAKLLSDVVGWCLSAMRMSDIKMSSLVGIFYNTHKYFVGSERRNQEATYNFFRESVLLHSVLHPPKSVKILGAEECKAALFYFCDTFLSILPILRLHQLPNYRLEVRWEPPAKHLEDEKKTKKK